MTENKNKLLNAALHYASGGFYVLPIKPNAKNPAIKFKDQPALTADQIKSWWTKNPQDNIALRTVDHFVIDVDSVQHTGDTTRDGFKSLDTIPKELLPDTLKEGTPSGGLHLYYAKPTNCKLQHQYIDWLGGIDIKANVNNYSVVAPSQKNGRSYHWLNKMPMVEAPQALIDYILTHGTNAADNKKPFLDLNSTGGTRSSRWTGQLLNEIAMPHPKSTRNNTIAYLTGKMLRADADIEAIYTILQDVNRRFYEVDNAGNKIAAPLSENELENTFMSIYRDEVKNHGAK